MHNDNDEQELDELENVGRDLFEKMRPALEDAALDRLAGVDTLRAVYLPEAEVERYAARYAVLGEALEPLAPLLVVRPAGRVELRPVPMLASGTILGVWDCHGCEGEGKRRRGADVCPLCGGSGEQLGHLEGDGQ